MVWNWQGHGRKQVGEGGSVGSATEAGVSTTWPSYEAGYLAARLADNGNEARAKRVAELDDKYMASDEIGDPERKQAYLDKVTEHYKDEADECLRAEFKDWLQGKHVANDENRRYVNRAGHPERKFVFRDDGGKGTGVGSGVPGERMDDWKPTWWGQGQLTHLPGVRDFLRHDEVQGRNADLKMQLLAEFGPQNVDDAWLYFKHWVKGRKMTDAACYGEKHLFPNLSARGPAGPQKAMEFYYRNDASDADEPPALEAYDGSGVALEGYETYDGNWGADGTMVATEKPTVTEPEADPPSLAQQVTSVVTSANDALFSATNDALQRALSPPTPPQLRQSAIPIAVAPGAATASEVVKEEDFDGFVVAWCKNIPTCLGAVEEGDLFTTSKRRNVYKKDTTQKMGYTTVGPPTPRQIDLFGDQKAPSGRAADEPWVLRP